MNNKILTMVLVCFILGLAVPVSAWEFDNAKIYDSVKREVKIKNSFDLPLISSTVAELRLVTPLNFKVPVGYQKVAEFDFVYYLDDNGGLDKIDTYKIDKETRDLTQEKDQRKIDYKIQIMEDILINDYEVVCQDNQLKNGTKIKECEKRISGSHTEKKKIWKDINDLEIKKGVRYTVGIFTEVKEGDFIEWIPTFYGVEIEEWATWEETLNVDLLSYYKLDETSGTTAEDAHGSTDGTANDARVFTSEAGGIINTGADFTAGDDYINFGDVFEFDSDDAFSVSLWFNTSTGDGSLFGKMASSGNYEGYEILVSGDGDIEVYLTASWTSDSLRKEATGFGDLRDGTLRHLVITYDGSTDASGLKIYINGTEETTYSTMSDTLTGSMLTDYDANLGARDSTNSYFEGMIDEVVIFNRTLNQTDIDNLYNGGDPPGYADEGAVDNYPNITLNSPSSANYSSSQDLTINLTAWDNVNLSDVKLYVNDALNQTNASGLNNTDYLFDIGLNDGDYRIYGKATDNSSQETNSDEIRIVIDSLAPNVTAINITNKTTSSLPYNLTWVLNASDLYLDKCYYNTSEEASQVLVTCNSTINATFANGGIKTVQYCANDTFSNEYCNSENFTLRDIVLNPIYLDEVIEGQNTSFKLNLSSYDIDIFNGTFYYNGVAYNTTDSNNGTIGTLYNDLLAPNVTETTTFNFYWSYNFNGVDYNTSTYEQNVTLLTPLQFSASCDDKALRFDIQDEQNLTNIYGDIEYNFQYGSLNGTEKEVYGSLNNVTTFYACINSSVTTNYTIGYGEIQYRTGDHVDRRYYLFEESVISNNTLTNISLRDLLTEDQTSFLATMEDTSLNTYVNKYTALWRWYPDLNEYQIVEMGKTDDDGQTVLHVNIEDTDYRIGLYELNGSLINLDNPRRFVCTTSPCSLTVRVGAGDLDYSSFFDVETSLTYNETSELFTLVYNDPNQLTSDMRLLVKRITGSSELIICNSTSSGYSGVISCNTSAYTGFKKAVVYRSASPEIIIAQKSVSDTNTTFRSSFGLFISIFIWLAIMLSGLTSSPIWILILSVIGLIPALIMGSINIAIFTGVAVLGAIVIHFIKRAMYR